MKCENCTIMFNLRFTNVTNTKRYYIFLVKKAAILWNKYKYNVYVYILICSCTY